MDGLTTHICSHVHNFYIVCLAFVVFFRSLYPSFSSFLSLSLSLSLPALDFTKEVRGRNHGKVWRSDARTVSLHH